MYEYFSSVDENQSLDQASPEKVYQPRILGVGGKDLTDEH
jgi:hypothetical protein